MRAFRTVCSTAVLWGVAAAMPAAYGQPQVEELRKEIRILRLEVALLQADYLARIISTLEAESARVEGRLRTLDQQERNLREEMAAAEQIAATTISATERLEAGVMAASRELRPGSDLVRLLAEKQDYAQRASELARQIQWERQRLQAALAAADRAKAESTPAQVPAPAR